MLLTGDYWIRLTTGPGGQSNLIRPASLTLDGRPLTESPRFRSPRSGGRNPAPPSSQTNAPAVAAPVGSTDGDRAEPGRGRRIRPVPPGITREHVLAAMAELNTGVRHDFHEPTKYYVAHEGTYYAPKAVVGLAARHAFGRRFTRRRGRRPTTSWSWTSPADDSGSRPRCRTTRCSGSCSRRRTGSRTPRSGGCSTSP